MYIYIHTEYWPERSFKMGVECFRGSGKVLLSGRYDCCYVGASEVVRGRSPES